MPEGLDAEVVSNGVDSATSAGRSRSKALDDALVAYEMNGEPLPPDHGFPVRLVVPGWVGVASIKWLGRIEVADEPLSSPWNTTQYRMTGPDYPPDSPPLTKQAVKSAFELPWGARRADRRNVPARPLVVGHGVGSPGGGERRRRPALAPRRAPLGPNPRGWRRWELRVDAAAAGQLRAPGARHDHRGGPSRTPCRSTTGLPVRGGRPPPGSRHRVVAAK